jgi:hypothetical protein
MPTLTRTLWHVGRCTHTIVRLNLFLHASTGSLTNATANRNFSIRIFPGGWGAKTAAPSKGALRRKCEVNLGRTVFAQLMDYLPSYEFQKCVARYG